MQELNAMVGMIQGRFVCFDLSQLHETLEPLLERAGIQGKLEVIAAFVISHLVRRIHQLMLSIQQKNSTSEIIMIH